MHVVDSEFIMQVWSCGKAGHAYITNNLALLNTAVCGQAAAEPGKMTIEGTVLVSMLDNNGIAIPAFLALKYDLAVSGRLDRSTYWSCIVHALMGAYAVEDWVHAAHIEA